MKRLITLTAAAVIALTSFAATPAAALSDRERDALGIVAGVVVLGTILNSADNDRARDDRRGYTTQADYDYYNKRDNRFDDDRRGKPRADRRKVIPGECVSRVRTRNGMRDVAFERCLSREGFDRRLPQDCAFNIRTDRGVRTVYGAQCLRNEGYRIGRH